MSVSVGFLNRVFNPAQDMPRLRYRVVRYSKANLGGPESAEIEASGDERSLLQLLSKLRYGVEIYAGSGPRGRKVWWGFIQEVWITIGALKVGVTLDRMSNRIAVAYEYSQPGTSSGSRRTTAWAQVDDAIAQYGYKELLAPLSNASDDKANRYRDQLLGALAWPVKQFAGFGNTAPAKAQIVCRGWWDTLQWRYFAATAEEVKTSYTQEPEDTTFQVGSASSDTKYAQQVQFTGSQAAYVPTKHRAKIVKIGNPTDNLIFEVCADAAGAPGSVLAFWQIAGATVQTAHTWVDLAVTTLSGVVAPSTTYWLQTRRSGAPDAANFYRVISNTARGYAGGVAKKWNGSAWVTNSPDADMLFELTFGSVKETMAQVKDILTATGQFFTGIDVEKSSGIYTNTFRSGDASAAQYLEELLSPLTVSGEKLTATVTPERRVRVFAENTLGASDYYIQRDGTLTTTLNIGVQNVDCLTGIWVRLKDSVVAGDYYGFIDGAEYTVAGDRYVPRLRQQASALDLFSMESG